MLKNTSGQKIALFAFDYSTGAPKTGDAANLTPYVNIDWGGIGALTDTSATEISSANAPGWYLFDVTQAETNGETLHFTGKSSTGNVAVVGQLVTTVDPAIASNVAAIKVKTDLIPSLVRTYGAVVEGSPPDNDALTFRTDLTESATDHWAHAFLTFLDGALAGQTRRITTYDGTTKAITTAGFTGTPAEGDTFVIVNI